MLLYNHTVTDHWGSVGSGKQTEDCPVVWLLARNSIYIFCDHCCAFNQVSYFFFCTIELKSAKELILLIDSQFVLS